MLIENPTISEHSFGEAFLGDELFRALPPETRNKVAVLQNRQLFGAHETIFARGHTPRFLYFFRDGDARIFYKDEQCDRVVVNEVFGLPETLSDLPYAASLVTLSPCAFDRIRCEDFLTLLRDEPVICFKLLQILGVNLQKLVRHLKN